MLVGKVVAAALFAEKKKIAWGGMKEIASLVIESNTIMNSNNNKYFNSLTKILTNEASLEEKALVDTWAKEKEENARLLEEVSKVWEWSGTYSKELPIDVDAAWGHLENKLPKEAVSQETKVRKLFPSWVAAAAIVGLLALGFWWAYQADSTITVPMAFIETMDQETKEVVLPDGSTVVLNENSSLSYNQNFNNRVVTLKGEAFFEVTKRANQPFEILTTTTKTTVLGTSFNVRAYANKATEVAVKTGKVKVEGLEGKKEQVLLLPNEVAVYHKETNQLQKKIDEGQNAMAWKTKRLSFENTELREVFGVLEQYFDINIEGDSVLLNCRYTGFFEEPKLEEILDIIVFAIPANLKVQKSNKKYIVTGEGCK